jgi:hypothetical protein
MLAHMDQTRMKRQAVREAHDKQNAAKATVGGSVRQGAAASQPRSAVARSAALDAYLESERIDKDSLSDLSEQQQLRLQQHAERRSKALALVSSLMKKTAETQQGVVKNMK